MRSLPKTLLILSPEFPQNEADTDSVAPLQSMVLSLKNNFPSLKIVILSFHQTLLKTEYRWNDIEVIPFDTKDKTAIRKSFAWFRAWKKLKRLHHNNDLVGLFTFSENKCALLGKYFAKRHGLRHHIWISGTETEAGNKYLRWLRPNTDDFIAMSDFLAKEFFKNHSIKPGHIIPAGIDTSLFSRHASERDIEILGVGSLVGSKQYDVFIEVVDRLKKRIPDINAMICGEGPEKNNLQSQISKLNLQGNILVEGKKSHAEILHLMQRSRIFLHTSSREGFNIVCLEALYAGASVVSFFKPMAAWINHWYIVRDKKEMVERILEILNDPETDHRPILPYSAGDSARAIMKLFDYEA